MWSSWLKMSLKKSSRIKISFMLQCSNVTSCDPWQELYWQGNKLSWCLKQNGPSHSMPQNKAVICLVCEIDYNGKKTVIVCSGRFWQADNCRVLVEDKYIAWWKKGISYKQLNGSGHAGRLWHQEGKLTCMLAGIVKYHLIAWAWSTHPMRTNVVNVW